jgi:diguanylate cyclase
VSRRISVGCGALLVVASVLAVVWSQQISGATARAEQTSEIADIYQDTLRYVELEAATLDEYRIGPTAAARNEYDDVARALAVSMTDLQSVEHGHLEDEIAVDSLHGVYVPYAQLSLQVVLLVAEGRHSEARQVDAMQVDPVSDAMVTELSALEEEHRAEASAALREATVAGTRLRLGTPIALTLALSMLAGLAVVGRGNLLRTRRQAMHDALTGLPNRLLFADRARQVLAAVPRSGARPVLMMLDLDRFKEVNDTLGHHQGDQLLIQVAGRLAGVLRPVDTVARLGGDEFAVLLADGGDEAGIRIATRIGEVIAAPFELNGVTVGVEASIGIATRRPDHGERQLELAAQVDELLQNADTAMYQAKAERCGYAHYAGGGASSALTHLTLLGELRQALDRDELVVHYQPKVASDTGELIGVEALVRWQHPTRGLLAPAEFIGLAEGTTLIHRLTTVVLDKALHLTRSWLDRGVRLPVAVNVSTRSLLDQGFPANVRDRLADAGVPGELLCLELTEGTIMADPERALIVLSELRAMGIRLSLDDFGTGYSSMAYLKILPVDELKVDKSFIRDITTNDGDAVLVQSAIDLGHNLGLAVVAEGVEDGETLVALKTLGADIIQGYYLGYPMPDDLLERWVSELPDRLARIGHEHQSLIVPPPVPRP